MDADLSTWLESDPRWPKFFYADRDAKKWYAGVGSKASLKIPYGSPLSESEEKLRAFSDTHTFLFCGLCFDGNANQGEEWEAFGAAQFVAPLELRRGTMKPQDAIPEGISMRSETELPKMEAQWCDLFARAKKAFDENLFEKVVLAQRKRIQSPTSIWSKLMDVKSPFCFGFSPTPGTIFFGASPELLFRKDGDRIESDALAGTRTRVQDAEKELLESEKDRREHQFVIDFLFDKFTKICVEVHVGKTRVKTLKHLLHLHTIVSGTLSAPSRVFAHLHPTPALCGFPHDATLRFLRAEEGFDRGWYGGAIGVVDESFESFSVGIRSILKTPDASFVYFGAGIVPASDCEEEWAEIHSKRAAIIANLRIP